MASCNRCGGVLYGKDDLCPRCGLSQVVADPVNAAPPETAGGERIGDYVMASKLGSGGMGDVWRAWDLKLGRWVALKFLKDDDPTMQVRFRREASIAARLSHPNIASIYEATDRYIAMQYVDGFTLHAANSRDPRWCAKILRRAALAVHHAHVNGVVHRDVKPANIMICGDHAYVMDFGLARATGVDSSLSSTGQILGTPSYMSPEQARGASIIGPASDVYSLGATLYELLVGRPPHVAAEIHLLLRKVLEVEPAPFRKWVPELEVDLETVTMKCLEKDPARRYRTRSPTTRPPSSSIRRTWRFSSIGSRPITRKATGKARSPTPRGRSRSLLPSGPRGLR